MSKAHSALSQSRAGVPVQGGNAEAARPAEKSRAGARANLPVEVLRVRVPPGGEDRRNPVVLVDTALGEMRVTFAVIARRRGVVVRPPEAADRGDGVTLPPLLAELVVEAVTAAAHADAEAGAVLARAHQKAASHAAP
ncbi:hypothetical protein [Falsiroseomonas oryzae]|uniref:hypothetical protein n=1 Tax=Falsiroseomonas oryzae TaxID=2766473 RepID=UPI0022EAC64B|nr:hypothetical protein [Roseomonas sp. MO-31]